MRNCATVAAFIPDSLAERTFILCLDLAWALNFAKNSSSVSDSGLLFGPNVMWLVLILGCLWSSILVCWFLYWLILSSWMESNRANFSCWDLEGREDISMSEWEKFVLLVMEDALRMLAESGAMLWSELGFLVSPNEWLPGQINKE